TFEDNGKKRAGGIVTRNLITGERKAHTGHAVILGTGGYGNVYHMSTLAKNSNAGALMRAYEQGAFFASPAFIQFHPTGLPVISSWQSKTILMSESLRNDGRIWSPKKERSEEHTSELQSRFDLVCRLLLEKKKLIILTTASL